MTIIAHVQTFCTAAPSLTGGVKTLCVKWKAEWKTTNNEFPFSSCCLHYKWSNHHYDYEQLTPSPILYCLIWFIDTNPNLLSSLKVCTTPASCLSELFIRKTFKKMFIVHTLYHIKGRHNCNCGYGPYPGKKCTSWGHGRVQDTGKKKAKTKVTPPKSWLRSRSSAARV